MEENSKDLPLVSNTNDILVQHYIFELFCDFEKCIFEGNVVLHVKSLQNITCECLTASSCVPPKIINKKDFLCVLDCCDIIINSIYEISIEDSDFYLCMFDGRKKDFKLKKKLNFSVDEWSLKIWKPNVVCPCCFPNYFIINYSTKREGLSVLWVKDQEYKPAVYTYGAWINNRSLFPCQEPPVAMATWEASISVQEPAIVLMSGDNRPTINSENGVTTYYYYTKMKLPLSTLALAVGYWKTEDLIGRNEINDLDAHIRICATPSLLPVALKEFSSYIYKCIKAAETFFGPYPFPRIDFLVVPRGFSSLGMASPNIIFLSQSILSNDGSMCSRIAHEIAHAWFGLLIGASDWTEEWLSEGFATFCEDEIHSKALELESCDALEYKELRAYMRSKVLLAELENTEEDDLLVLRPNKGETVIQSVENVNAIVLKNGRNTEKAFMQVHYIKGYFLLRYLCEKVGVSSFLEFLRSYIVKFKGQLVDSMEMLEVFTEMFPLSSVETAEDIAAIWLHSSSIPPAITSIASPVKNSVYSLATAEATKWKALNGKYLKRKSAKRRKYDTHEFLELSCDALWVLLDILLECRNISPSIMKLLDTTYRFSVKNAEIRHKWCELVVKHRYYAGYAAVEKFMTDDLAMGVYLYGELVLNGTKSQKEFAEKCFDQIQTEMEPNSVAMVKQIFAASLL